MTTELKEQRRGCVNSWLCCQDTMILSMESSCIKYKGRLVFDDRDNEHDHSKYLLLLSHGRLTVPCVALIDFIFQTLHVHVSYILYHPQYMKRKKRKI